VDCLRKVPTILAEVFADEVSGTALFHHALERMMVGIVVLDLEGRIQYANAAYCEMTGFAAEELAGREFVALQPREEQEEMRTQMACLLRGEQGTLRLAERHVREDGATVWVRIGASMLHDDKGEARAAIAVIEDISSLHRSEEALHSSQSLLRRTEKLAAAGRLAATVAHEINNPLEAVSNLLYLALHEQGMPAVSKRYLRMANEELRRVSSIVSQTLGFYRESGVPQPVELQALVDDVLMLYQRKLDARQIRVTRSMESAVVEGVPGELRQVVANLLSNAIDAMEPYGVLAIELHRHRDEVRLSISDTGHGIATPLLDRIFEPFFTTKKDVGTGLGLWVSKGIVEKHQGRLEVVSSQREEDHGTAFIMTLPRRAVLRRSA
jgi:PAS domain S-box-containing protein